MPAPAMPVPVITRITSLSPLVARVYFRETGPVPTDYHSIGVQFKIGAATVGEKITYRYWYVSRPTYDLLTQSAIPAKAQRHDLTDEYFVDIVYRDDAAHAFVKGVKYTITCKVEYFKAGDVGGTYSAASTGAQFKAWNVRYVGHH
jgi:hypothetical protein